MFFHANVLKFYVNFTTFLLKSFNLNMPEAKTPVEAPKLIHYVC